MPGALCHFEFMSDDPEACKRFYARVLGWKFDDASMPGYTFIDTGSEPGGGIMKRPEQAPAAAMNAYFLVDDIAATLQKITAAGGTVHCEETEIPQIGWYAFATDPEGVPFGLFKAARPQ